MRYLCWMESRDVDITGHLKDLTGRGSGCCSETPFLNQSRPFSEVKVSYVGRRAARRNPSKV